MTALARSRRATGTVALLLLSADAGSAATGPIAVAAAARALQPGELVVLTLTTPAGVDGVRVSAFGRAIPAAKVEPRAWRVLVGIDLDAAPGKHAVSIRARSGENEVATTYDLVVKPRRFATRRLLVDEAMVNPPAAMLARMLGLPVAAGAKERHSDTSVTISSIIGDVANRDVIVLDDEIARGTTIMELLEQLREHGARSVRIACTHGLFTDGAMKRITSHPEVIEVVCTNTVPIPESERDPKLHVISLAPALAEAIRRIHEGESVSALFGAIA